LEGGGDALVGLRVVVGSELEVFEADEVELVWRFGFGKVVGLALGTDVLEFGGHLGEGWRCGVLGEGLMELLWAEG
jgi:hypothetical protein